MTQEEKISKLKRWLDYKGVKYDEPVREPGDFIVMFVPRKRIVVFTCPAEKEDFCYELAMANNMRAFFIREDEKAEFVCEKMGNCLKGKTLKNLQPKKPKRKRIQQPKTIRHEKINYNKRG